VRLCFTHPKQQKMSEKIYNQTKNKYLSELQETNANINRAFRSTTPMEKNQKELLSATKKKLSRIARIFGEHGP